MVRIPLTKGKFAIIDNGDAHLVSPYRWYTLVRGKCIHAARTIKKGGIKKTVYMHSVVMGVTGGQMVDHVNMDGLDNRKQNLRLCSKQQNAMNSRKEVRGKTSRFKGVSLYSARVIAKGKPWRATIVVNGKQKYLGWYETEELAAKAYDIAAVRFFGEFAACNF